MSACLVSLDDELVLALVGHMRARLVLFIANKNASPSPACILTCLLHIMQGMEEPCCMLSPPLFLGETLHTLVTAPCQRQPVHLCINQRDACRQQWSMQHMPPCWHLPEPKPASNSTYTKVAVSKVLLDCC